MNTSGSSTAQQCCTGPNWGAENNWEQNSGVTGLEPRVHFQGNNNSNNSSGRLDWGWDNAMLLSHHHHNHGDHHGDRKAHMTAAAAALVNSGGIRSSSIDGVLPGSGFASSLVHGHMGLFSANPGLRTFAPGMEGSPAGIHLLSGLTDIVKRENVDGLSRIGLNLGGRTYFSSEDSGSGRLVKRPRGNGPGSQVPMCQAEGCKADLSSAKHYHRRHKVCELHSKAATVITGGQSQRFCQQCSRFHMLSEFDDGKRSCRKRLADHNRRRRKPQPNNNDGTRIANGESTALKDDVQDSSANNRSTGGQANSMSGSDSQALLSAISLSPPVSVMIQNNNNNSSSNNNRSNNNNSSGSNNHNNHSHHNLNQRQQLSIVSGSTQAEAMYQYMHVVPQTGPQLSLSSLGGRGIAAMEDQWQQRGPAGPRKYDCIEPSVPWLRHNAGGSRTESAINLQPIMATKSSDNNSASSNGSCSQVFSPSVQNLLPIQSSRSSISGAGNWVMNSVQQATHNAEHTNGHFGNISSMNVHGSLEGQQVLSLLESPAFRDQRVRCTEGATAAVRQQQQRPAVEFLQQQTSSSETESSRSGSGQQGDVKFPDLQTLRPFASTNIYDAANTGLL